jgi:AraC family transcriptional regulator
LPRYKLRRAVDYINDNIVEDLSFRDIAAHLKMSAYHFARMFKQSTGESPHRYIVRRRMERAKTLLADAKLPIADVAFEVGYKSQSHFTTAFGRLTGVTPAAFRVGI